MLRKGFAIAWSALPRLDDWIMSAITACVAAGMFVAASAVPEIVSKPASIVAHTFGIMSVYRLVGVTYMRTMRHAVCFVKHRLGLGAASKEEPLL